MVGRVWRRAVVQVFMVLTLWALGARDGWTQEEANRDAAVVAARIDAFFADRYRESGVTPAPIADDAEFLRRVYLDLGGRIPLVWETRQFIEDESGDKRRQVVERLLASPNYVNRFVNVWRKRMLPEAASSFQKRFLTPGFENWLRKHVRANTPYDQMVRELLTTQVTGASARSIYTRAGGQANPAAFYAAKDFQPENVAAATARIFLGVKLECAQCHDHPFADWKQDQFWSFAAFFGGIKARRNQAFAVASRENPKERTIKIPDTQRTVSAAYLDGTEPDWRRQTAPTREVLANWITGKENSYFARTAVNRLWEQLMGRGLIDPVDGMFDQAPDSANLPLLNELAQAFVESGFDLKYMARVITASQTYQRSSAVTGQGQDQTDLFARRVLRGLTGEQLYDSLVAATGNQAAFPRGRRVVFRPGGSPKDQFLTLFANETERPIDQTTSILQALAMMNGNLATQATDLKNSGTLAAVLHSPFMNQHDKIEALYLAALSRKPTEKELARMSAYVAQETSTEGGDESVGGQALADVFWVLLNSGEFATNH